jgi:predicted dehydrogenase
MPAMSALSPVSVALVGIGGYGEYYLKALLADQNAGRVRLVAGIDPAPARCTRLSALESLGIPIYADLESFFLKGVADLVVISSPIHLHADQACQALARGCHVLCEKPLCSTFQEAERMIAAHRASGRHAAIGYQWSFAPQISALKRDIMSGRFGKPVQLKTRALWPRTFSYYGRSPWAGALRTKESQWVLDSPINNATAHYLHNAFFCLGDARDSCARPRTVVAELYRANDIGNHDTAVIRARTAGGAEIFYVASHAAGPVAETVISYRFERATIEYRRDAGTIAAVFADGARHEYGSADTHDDMEKLWAMVEAIRGGATPACPPSAAIGQTLCVNGAQESMPDIVAFPPDLVETSGEGDERRRLVPGLHEALTRCFDEGKLPSELGYAWARPGRTIDLDSYRSYPSSHR